VNDEAIKLSVLGFIFLNLLLFGLLSLLSGI